MLFEMADSAVELAVNPESGMENNGINGLLELAKWQVAERAVAGWQ
jgi:hypothetical protein